MGGRPNLVYSPGPGLWSLVLGPFGPDLGRDLDVTWDLDLDLSLTIGYQFLGFRNDEHLFKVSFALLPPFLHDNDILLVLLPPSLDILPCQNCSAYDRLSASHSNLQQCRQ